MRSCPLALFALLLGFSVSAAPAPPPVPPPKPTPPDLATVRQTLPTTDPAVMQHLLKCYTKNRNAQLKEVATYIGSPDFKEALEEFQKTDKALKDLERNWALYKKLGGVKPSLLPGNPL